MTHAYDAASNRTQLAVNNPADPPTVNAKTVKDSDSITYTISDRHDGTATATLSIFVDYAQ